MRSISKHYPVPQNTDFRIWLLKVGSGRVGGHLLTLILKLHSSRVRDKGKMDMVV